MLIELTAEQRNNILGLISRAPKLPNESSFEFAKVVTNIEQTLFSPIPEPSKPELVEPTPPIGQPPQ